VAISIISHTTAHGSPDTGTSPSIDTSGADFLLAFLIDWNGTSPTFSDNKSNSWSLYSPRLTDSVNNTISTYYVQNPPAGKTGTGHTFTATYTGHEPTAFIIALSGVDTFDTAQLAQAASPGNSAQTQQAGSVTAKTANDLFLACGASLDSGNFSLSIDGGFSIYESLFTTPGSLGAAASLIGSGGKNPTWTFSQLVNSRLAVLLSLQPAPDTIGCLDDGYIPPFGGDPITNITLMS